MNTDPSVNDNRKVTLSCRVLPEQKLMIAEKAKGMNMSPSQYTEAKVLREDVLPLEKKIAKQRAEIESLKAKLFQMEQDKGESIVKLKKKYKGKIKTLQGDVAEATEQSAYSLLIQFSDAQQLNAFTNRLKLLKEKYQIKSNLTTLEMSITYTLQNDKATFFLKRVSEFYNENYKA